MLLLADAEEAAERHHGVDRLAADLVDHDVLDRAEMLAVHVVDVGAVDLVGGDQGAAGDLGERRPSFAPPEYVAMREASARARPELLRPARPG
jgi:hypothetical protein